MSEIVLKSVWNSFCITVTKYIFRAICTVVSCFALRRGDRYRNFKSSHPRTTAKSLRPFDQIYFETKYLSACQTFHFIPLLK